MSGQQPGNKLSRYYLFDDVENIEHTIGEAGCREGTGQVNSSGESVRKIRSPAKRGRAVEHVYDAAGMTVSRTRHACQILGQSRATQRRQAHVPEDEPSLGEQAGKIFIVAIHPQHTL